MEEGDILTMVFVQLTIAWYVNAANKRNFSLYRLLKVIKDKEKYLA